MPSRPHYFPSRSICSDAGYTPARRSSSSSRRHPQAECQMANPISPQWMGPVAVASRSFCFCAFSPPKSPLPLWAPIHCVPVQYVAKGTPNTEERRVPAAGPHPLKSVSGRTGASRPLFNSSRWARSFFCSFLPPFFVG